MFHTIGLTSNGFSVFSVPKINMYSLLAYTGSIQLYLSSGRTDLKAFCHTGRRTAAVGAEGLLLLGHTPYWCLLHLLSLPGPHRLLGGALLSLWLCPKLAQTKRLF